MLVAAVIAALALGVMVRASAGGVAAVRIAAHVQEATARARSRLAVLEHGPAPEAGQQAGEDGGGYRYGQLVSVSARAPGLALYVLSVTLAWRMDGGDRQVTPAVLAHGPGAAGATVSGPAPRHAPEAGFTLLEVLVALVILGLLIAGLTGGVRLGVRAVDQQARAIDGDAGLDAVDRALRRLIAEADPGDRTHPAGVAGSATRLQLATILPQALSGLPGDTVLLAEGSRLVLRWQPRLPGIPTGPRPAMQEAELLGNLSGVRFAYYGPNGWESTWDPRRSADADPDPLRVPAVGAGSALARHRGGPRPDPAAYVACRPRLS